MRTKKPFPPDIIKRIEALLSSIRIESCLRIRSKLGKQIREANFTGLVLLLNANWYKDVINQNCPQVAIGGGTDAKGNLQLWAAGALFDTKMGPPINFHGQNEGAPIAHLKIGAKILYRLMCNEIEECP